MFDPWVGKNPWREGIATYSNIVAWEIPWTEEPGGLNQEVFLGSKIKK